MTESRLIITAKSHKLFITFTLNLNLKSFKEHTENALNSKTYVMWMNLTMWLNENYQRYQLVGPNFLLFFLNNSHSTKLVSCDLLVIGKTNNIVNHTFEPH